MSDLITIYQGVRILADLAQTLTNGVVALNGASRNVALMITEGRTTMTREEWDAELAGINQVQAALDAAIAAARAAPPPAVESEGGEA